MTRTEPDARERALAAHLVDKTVRLRRGESALIEAWSHSLPSANAVAYAALERGAHPLVMYHDDPVYWATVEAGRAKELGRVGAHEYAALAKTDAYFYFEGPEDRGRFQDLPERTRQLLTAWEWDWWRVARKSGLRLAWVLLGRAVASSARHYGIDLDRWREELYRATLVDPALLQRTGRRVARRLEVGRRLVVTHPNGTHLEMRLRRRPVHVRDGVVDARDVADGRFLEELPSGFVPTPLDERFAEGEVFGNVPSRTIDDEAPVAGAHWTFRGGRLAAFSHEVGQAEIEADFAAAPVEGRDRIGVFSVGLNPEIRSAPLVSDQRLGRIMLIAGGNRMFGGSNGSSFRTYLLLDGASVEVDGKPLLTDGKLR